MPGRIFTGAFIVALLLAVSAALPSAGHARAVHAMKVDSTALTSKAFFLGDRWYEGIGVETVELAAGNYVLHPGSGLVMACPLVVTDAGTWQYGTECDGFLAGRGTDTLTLRGFTVTIDATRLSTPISLANLTIDQFGASPR